MSYQSWLEMANKAEFEHLVQCWEWSGGKPTGGPCQHWRCTRCNRVIPLYPLLFGDAIPLYQFQPLPQLCSDCDWHEFRERARAAKNKPKRFVYWASMARKSCTYGQVKILILRVLWIRQWAFFKAKNITKPTRWKINICPLLNLKMRELEILVSLLSHLLSLSSPYLRLHGFCDSRSE